MAYDNTGGIIAAAVILEVLAVLCTSLRFLSRRMRAQGYRADDWLTVPAMISATALVGIDIFSFVTLPKHFPPNESTHGSIRDRTIAVERAQLSMYVITAVAMAFIKCSLACLYKRVFVDTLFATIVNVFMVVIVIWALAVTFGIIFGCGTDFGALFPGPGGSLCRPYYNMGIAAFSIDIVLDIGLVILPLPIIWRLQATWKKRFGVASIFLIGFLAVGAAAGRLVAWIKDTGINNVSATSTTEASIWNLVSVHVGIITACLPTFGPLCSHLLGNPKVIRVRTKAGAKFARLALPFMDDKQSQISDRSRQQRSNPLLSSAHASDPDISAFPSDTEMQPNDVYVRRDMTVEEEQIPQPVNADSWFDV